MKVPLYILNVNGGIFCCRKNKILESDFKKMSVPSGLPPGTQLEVKNHGGNWETVILIGYVYQYQTFYEKIPKDRIFYYYYQDNKFSLTPYNTYTDSNGIRVKEDIRVPLHLEEAIKV